MSVENKSRERRETLTRLLQERIAPSAGPAPLSYGQQALLYFHHRQPGSSAYNTRFVIGLPSDVKADAIGRAFDVLVARHAVLRTVYPGSADMQRVVEDGRCDFRIIDARTWSETDLAGRIEREAARRFDLENGPVLRVRLYEREDSPQLLIAAHHIAIDYWSFQVVLNELALIYGALTEGGKPELPRLRDTYAEFARRQRQYGESAEAAQCLDFWRGRLERAEALKLPLDRTRPAEQSYDGDTYEFRLPVNLPETLRGLARAEKTTLYSVCFAALATLMHRWSRQERVVIGTPSAGRKSARSENVVGYFLNLVPVISDGSGHPSFREFLQRTYRTVHDAVDHADYPFPLLVDRLGIERQANRAPLCDVVFSWDKPHENEAARAAGFEVLSVVQHGGPFDLIFILFERGSSLAASIQYDSHLFDPETIANLASQYICLLEAAVRDADTPIDRLAMMREDQRDLILSQWARGRSDYPRQRIDTVFRMIARTRPQSIAVEQDAQALTYEQLDRFGNAVAQLIRGRGAKPGQFVGLMMERSVEQIIALIGILKAGCAYCPLEVSYPAERLAFMLGDADVSIVITDGRFENELPDWVDRVRVSQANFESQGFVDEVAASSGADDAAYLMYTSGTTGKPKGVVVPHRAVVRLVCGTNFMHFGPDEVFLQLAPISFDASTLELWGPLLHGGRLVLASPGASSLAEIGRTIRDNGITALWLTSGLFQLMIEQRAADLRGVKQLLAGGDVLSPAHVRRALDELPDTRLINGYGPTENTTFTCCQTITRADLARPSIPIGRPIANTFVYILDEALEPVGVGMPGALWTGGDGVALGYWNRPELTAERFLPDPFRAGGTMYATGDRARWLADGTLEFLGRGDEQVKIRGFRIEPGEIEAALQEHPAVSQAVVLARETPHGTGKRLLAWVALRSGARVSGPQLREYLQGRLPEYLVPAACVVLDALPLSANGKVDRAALPEPEMASDLHPAESRKLPREASGVRAEIERKLAAIWQRALHVESIPRQANFFEIGGHSLLLIKVHAELERELAGELAGREVKIVDLFRYPTLRALAGFLAGSAESQTEPAYEADEEGQRAHSGWEPMAIIAMTGRFPGAPSVEQLWEKLRAGEEMIRPFTEEELRSAGVPEAEYSAAHYVKAGTVLENCESFDARYFGFNPREAEITDPQHRVFLECAHEALERAGYDPARYRGRIGVFAGSTMSSYWTEKLMRNRQALENVGYLQTLIGNDKDFVPTRVAYKLNLRGPAVNVQTACSTSLVAVHMACESLAAGTCDMALAGGVSIRFPQPAGYLYQAESIMSPDGHCRPFDEQAAGTVAGNGAGIVLLKRLADAERDGDRIEAVILGSAINNDGSNKVGYTAPGVDGQAAVIRAALERAGIAPDSVTAIEAHGTGTKLGDPIEVAALKAVFGEQANEFGPRCALASAKGNLGHLDAAAGVTGLIKATLQLQHGELVGMPHSGQPNPALGLAQSRFYLPTGVVAWERKGGRRRIGVSSFGIGGTNAHVVLEEAPVRDDEQNRPARDYELLALSAKTETALNRLTLDLADYLERHPAVNLADVAYTLAVGRAQHPWRRTVVCQSTAQAIQALRTLDPETVRSGLASETSRPLVFMFPGGGTQYPGMGRNLYDTQPVFRAEIDRCAEILRSEMGLDIRDWLYPAETSNEIVQEMRKTRIGLPALFATEYANAKLLMSEGLHPSALIGHSLGEYVCAAIAEVLALEDTLKLVAARSRLMHGLPEGAMLIAHLSESEVRPWLNESIAIAAINAPKLCVISGPKADITEAERKLEAGGVEVQRLHIDVASHSPLVEGILCEFGAIARCFQPQPARIPYISNLTGTWITPGEIADPDYWTKHLRNTVLFSKGVGELVRDTGNIFVEAGPGRTLTSLAARHPGHALAELPVTISSMRHPHDPGSDSACLAAALAQVWVAGGRNDSVAHYRGQSRRRIFDLPTYPFERERYTVTTGKALDSASLPVWNAANCRLLSDSFYTPVWKESPRPRLQAALQTRGDWLMFLDEHGVLEFVARRLEDAGQNVVRVSAGATFDTSESGHFTIRPLEPDDYVGLIAALNVLPTNILHAFGVSRERQPLESAKANSFYSLVYLMQAMGEHGGDEPVNLRVITTGMQRLATDEESWPEKALALGPVRVIPEEYSKVKCQGLDLPVRWTDRDLALMADELQREISEAVLAIRHGEMWTEAFETVRLPEMSQTAANFDLRASGVYAITGGSGGMALEIADYLARKTGAAIALISRSGAPNREHWDSILASGELSAELRLVRKLIDIEMAGGTVRTYRADAASFDEMEAVFEAIELEFGRIDGIIHAAGVAGEGLIQLKTAERVEPVLRAKVDAVFALERLIEKRSPDFVVLCSSLSSVLGGAGHVDYCAANAVLDAFARSRRGQAGPLITAVNWNTWKGIGMAANVQMPELLAGWKALVHDTGISVEEGQQAFARVLAAGLPQVAVSTIDLTKLRADHAAFTPPQLAPIPTQSEATAYRRPNLGTQYSEPRNETERSIAAIWSELLGIERTGVHDNFFALGGHSLLGVRMLSKLETASGVKVSLKRLFAAPTPAGLAQAVAELAGMSLKESGPQQHADYEMNRQATVGVA